MMATESPAASLMKKRRRASTISAMTCSGLMRRLRPCFSSRLATGEP
jgi:hypothetical protein